MNEILFISNLVLLCVNLYRLGRYGYDGLRVAAILAGFLVVCLGVIK